MRSLLILALAAGCNHKSAPTDDWCQTYVDELRRRAEGNVHSMTLSDANRRFAVERLRAMVGSDPALAVAFEVCSDAADDSPASKEARALRINDLHHDIANYVVDHGEVAPGEAQARQFKQLFEQLAHAYADPAPQ